MCGLRSETCRQAREDGLQLDCGRRRRQTEGGFFTNGMRNQTKGWKEQTVGEGEDKQMGCERRREQPGGVAVLGSGLEGEIKDEETSIKEEKWAKQVERKKSFLRKRFEIRLVRLTIAEVAALARVLTEIKQEVSASLLTIRTRTTCLSAAWLDLAELNSVSNQSRNLIGPLNCHRRYFRPVTP